MRRLYGLLKILPAAPARIDKISAHELLHSLAIRRQTLALAHLSVPIDSQPAQVLSHSLCEVGARALRVEILIPKPQQSSCSARPLGRNPERPCMSKVEKTRRRRREPPEIARLAHSHPRCRAILAASMRFAAPSLAIASDR